MCRVAVIFLFLSIIFKVEGGRKFKPDYIKACHTSSPDFKKCCITNGNNALPSLLKGDKSFDIPFMLPLRYPKVDVDAGPNLKIFLSEIDLFGLDTLTLTDMDMDFDKKTGSLSLDVKHASLIGQYDVDGKLMVLPVTGKGPINITIENSHFIYSFHYTLDKKDGIEYGNIQPNDHLDFKIGRAYFYLENLFNGNKLMGDNVNKFLNENQEEVIKELSGAISGTIAAIARKVGSKVIGHIPYNELFLA